MPYLALTRAGVCAFLEQKYGSSSLWIGSNVLSAEEIKALWSKGSQLSVFDRPIRTVIDIEGAVPTLREHHPDETVWIEAIPKRPNPRSEDVGQAFLWHEFIVGVSFEHDARVVVTAGRHAGDAGNLAVLVSVEPEVIYVVENDRGKDIEIAQSLLVREP